MPLDKRFGVSETDSYSVIDILKVAEKKQKQREKIKASDSEENLGAALQKKRKEGTRLTKSSGTLIEGKGDAKIGGPFVPGPNPEFIRSRMEVYDRIIAKQKEEIASMTRFDIRITLPDGDVKQGTAWETTPLDIALQISEGMANSIVVAKVRYMQGVKDPFAVSQADVDGNESAAASVVCCGGSGIQAELWDATRPLIGDCKLQFLKFEDPEGKAVFWHSSAHVLGECIECSKGAHLTIGPPVQGGFYYDCYMGENTVQDSDLKAFENAALKIVKEKQRFERIVLTKHEALEMFRDNPFKTQIISTKIPDNGKTTAYRCGPLIDLCRGPHVPHTGKIKAFAVTRNSSSYWLGKASNDSLQRVYGISFPEKNKLKVWKHFQEEAAKRDHRKLGLSHDLWFFHHLSPGCSFFQPHGTRIFTKLLEFQRKNYRERGFHEVITPNMFNMDLWVTSGHAKHYRDDMFHFEVEKQEFALKPMNCPSHCLMFDHRLRSYRELPLRYADFGVLHRNELSGALTGLTRVRRFQQDDAHIFCRDDQIKDEVVGALNFMKDVYDKFGLKYQLELSTRPEKALGEISLWRIAEEQLEVALNEFAGKGNWRENPGDGAFYGPKIDIKLTDALERIHQCATVQLDFQLPIRFDLKYRTDEEGDAGYKKPVIIHRAIFGSLERFIAIITEHWAGKYPFWISPRQVLIVSVGAAFTEYGYTVKDRIFRAGFHVDIDDSGKTLNKKIREGQLAQYNFILVVGAKEQESGSVNVRTRDNEVKGTMVVDDAVQMMRELEEAYQ